MTRIDPLLSVRRAAEAVEFYKSAFGAVELFRLDSEDGALIAQLGVDGGVFWVSSESPENGNFSPESLGGGTVRIVMTVDDPDSAFKRAIEAGAKEVWPVADRYGWRLGRVADPYGHDWEIGKPLS